ncbi:YcaO-like family protein [Actinokineospora guangxiensis]|uniref:YcaO-like family protein n=1 Tax=Actinokineospora guangxiensis TaxID=1490288 RepID=A0ABW0ET80_9PSEU
MTPGQPATTTRRAPAFPIRHDGPLTYLGPLPHPDAPGCADCAESARREVTARPADPAVVAPALALAVRAVRKAVTTDALYSVDTTTGRVRGHRVGHRPECPAGAPAPASVPTRAVPGTLRVPNPGTALPALRAELVDERHGPITSVSRVDSPLPLAVVSAELGGSRQAGVGRTGDFAAAERVALLEALERRCGIGVGANAVITASLAELGPDALDPRLLGLHPDAAYDSGELTRFAPDQPIRWVHGWDHSAGRAIAVPEQVAFWGAPGPRFLRETSSGCGLGGSREEAALHGFFECAERDAFLMAWYTRAPLPRLRVPAREGFVPHLDDRMADLGYRARYFDATNDLGVPTVLAWAEHRGGPAPAAFFAAGAHPDPATALRSAAAELALCVVGAAEQARHNPHLYDRARLLPMLDNPDLVRTMDDHVALYGLPEAAPAYTFLREGPTVDLPAPPPWLADGPSLPDLLTHYADHLRPLNLPLFSVDQSDPTPRSRLGLWSTKVIIPGTLPMTFGHRFRRLTNLPRLHATHTLPHPFP